jgi:exopolysaccharide biosynthesis polyprenyl glycosylphosphotransferase
MAMRGMAGQVRISTGGRFIWRKFGAVKRWANAVLWTKGKLALRAIRDVVASFVTNLKMTSQTGKSGPAKRGVTAILIAADMIAFAAIWFGLWAARDALADKGVFSAPINALQNYIYALPIYLALWLTTNLYYGLYDHSGKVTGINQISRILRAFIAGAVGSLSVAYLFKQWDIGRVVLLGSSSAFFVYLYASRSILRAWKHRQLAKGIGVTRVLIIGLGRTAKAVMERIRNHPEGGYELVGFVDPYRKRRLAELGGLPVVGTTAELADVLRRSPVDVVFLAVPRMPQNEMLNLIVNCEDLGVQFKIVSNIFDVITSQVQVDVIDEVPVIHLRNSELPVAQRALKRLLDIVVAAILLLFFAVPMLIIALLVRLDSRGPALFRQLRIGKGGRPFTMLKFRTMRIESDPYCVAPTDPDDGRITRLGRWLRRYSIDEFPQLLNVLAGQMSMVGPRPEMPFLVEQYEEWQRRRLDVKPGVTGLWQIVGRKNLPLSLNMEYDFYYIKNQSLFFDLVILLKTIPAVFFGRGAF